MQAKPHAQPYPRFLRLGGYELMVELHAHPWPFAEWLRPSTLTTEGGDWLAWCGPLHVAVSKV